MKKILVLGLITSTLLLQFCNPAKKAQATKVPVVTYAGNISTIMTANCTPCHFPPQGNKKPLNSYDAAKTNIDEILVRINKNPNEKGFMPMRHPKLSDSTIKVFSQWKADGLLEK
jgi:hypothetical protein